MLHLQHIDPMMMATKAPLKLNDSQLARLALQYAGGGGYTEEGTAEAMVWMAAAMELKDGDSLALPNSKLEVIGL